MPINDDLSRYEALAAPTASLSPYESQPPQRPHVANMRDRLPSSGLRAVPPQTWSVEDTPVYWQTVEAMAIDMWRRER